MELPHLPTTPIIDHVICEQSLNVFKEQIALFKEMAVLAPPTQAQASDIDFPLTAGEMFTLVVYGQLILENAGIYEVDREVLDQIFDFMVRLLPVRAADVLEAEQQRRPDGAVP